MGNCLYLPITVKQRAEDYIRGNNPRIEHGGYFLGRESTLLIPRFYPNRSEHPESSYKGDVCAVDYAQLDARLFGMDLFIDFHTHPNHSITSEQDLKYSAGQPLANLNVMIGYNTKEDAFTWHAYQNNALEITVLVVDDQYPIFKELFSQSLRLTSLGDCFLTPEGELLANNPIAKVIINVDAEAMRVYVYYTAKRWLRHTWSTTRSKSKTQIAQDLGITVDKLQKVVTRLQARGVKDVFIPNSRGGIA